MADTLVRRGRDGVSSRRLQPNPPRPRASSSRSDASRSIRSKTDESEPSSPISESSESCYTITGILSPQLKRLPSKKVHDEWAKVFSKWNEMRTSLDAQLLVASHKEEAEGLSLMTYLLKLSRDPEQDDQLDRLVSFVGQAEGHIAINLPAAGGAPDPAADPFRQQSRVWVDHQVWVTGYDKARTIPEQPNRILAPSDLADALHPLRPARISRYYPDSYYRRVVYVGDGDAATVSEMTKQLTVSESWAIGELFRGYFRKNTQFRLQVEVISMPAKVANIILQFPYLSFAKEKREDSRIIDGRPLRDTYELSCLQVLAPDGSQGSSSSSSGKMYLNEGMMSIAIEVRDDRWWGVTCFNDEFLAGSSRLEDEAGDEENPDGRDKQDEQPTVTQQPPPADLRGLRALDLEQVEPVLDEAGGYTNKNPRIYMLIALSKQLDTSLQKHEMVYTVISEHVKSYKKSGLRRTTSEPDHSARMPSKTKIKDALDEVSQFVGELYSHVKQNEDELIRFMKKDLGLDPSAKSPNFKDPLFVGLNKAGDPAVQASAMRIIQMAGKLHSLRHRVEDLMKTVSDMRKKVVEDLQVAQHDYAAPGLKLGILHSIIQALTIPLNLYNVPLTVSMLPDTPAGLAGVTVGLTTLFLVAYFVLSLLFDYAPHICGLFTSWRDRLWCPSRKTKLRRD